MGSRKLEAGSSIFHFSTRQILLSSSLYSFFHASVPSYLVRAESTAEILAAGDWKSIPDAKVIRKKTPRFRQRRINVPLSRYKRPRWKATSTFLWLIPKWKLLAHSWDRMCVRMRRIKIGFLLKAYFWPRVCSISKKRGGGGRIRKAFRKTTAFEIILPGQIKENFSNWFCVLDFANSSNSFLDSE